MIKQNHIQCSQPAWQAALRPIDNSRFFAGRLTDGLARSLHAQIWPSDASRAIWSSLVSLDAVSIHNFSLWIVLSENTASISVQVSLTCLDRGSILSLCTDKLSRDGTIPTLQGIHVLGTGKMETGCSGTSFLERQKRVGCFPSSEEGSRRSGRNEVESFDRTGYNPNQKTRVAYTNVAQYTPPSFSAPLDQPSCQNLPSERAITNEWSGLPFCHCCNVASPLLRGAKVVTRTALTASLESEVFSC